MRIRFWLPLKSTFAAALAFGLAFGLAGDGRAQKAYRDSDRYLEGCWKLSEYERNVIDSFMGGCIVDKNRCDILLMDTTEAEAKVEEIQRWNEANTPYRYRKLQSGFGPCDEKRQVYVQKEVTTGAPPPKQPSVQPHWERGSGGAPTYVDEKGQRWRFPEMNHESLRWWKLDRSRLPTKEQVGALVHMFANYKMIPENKTDPQNKTKLVPGEMVSEAPQTDPQAPPQRQQNDPCQYNPMLYRCLPQ